MQVVPSEEENDAEVRREDQDNINKFARLNARLHDLRSERDLIQVISPLILLRVTSVTAVFYGF